MGMDITAKEFVKRSELRVPLIGSVDYFVDGNDNCACKGITVDISPSGAAIYTHRELREGEGVRIFGRKLWENYRSGTVKWCTRISDDIFKAGLALN